MGTTPSKALYNAARNGNVEGIARALSQGGDVNYRNGHLQVTPLITAAKRGHIEAVKYLLLAGAADLRCRTGDGALHFAARMNHAAVIAVLLDRGADHHSRNTSNQLPIDVAAMTRHTNIVRLIECRTCPFFASLEVEKHGFFTRVYWEKRWFVVHRARPWDNPAVPRHDVQLWVYYSTDNPRWHQRMLQPELRPISTDAATDVVTFDIASASCSTDGSSPKPKTLRCRSPREIFAWLQAVLGASFPTGRGPGFDAGGNVLMPTSARLHAAAYTTDRYTTPLVVPMPTPMPAPAMPMGMGMGMGPPTAASVAPVAAGGGAAGVMMAAPVPLAASPQQPLAQPAGMHGHVASASALPAGVAPYAAHAGPLPHAQTMLPQAAPTTFATASAHSHPSHIRSASVHGAALPQAPLQAAPMAQPLAPQPQPMPQPAPQRIGPAAFVTTVASALSDILAVPPPTHASAASMASPQAAPVHTLSRGPSVASAAAPLRPAAGAMAPVAANSSASAARAPVPVEEEGEPEEENPMPMASPVYPAATASAPPPMVTARAPVMSMAVADNPRNATEYVPSPVPSAMPAPSASAYPSIHPSASAAVPAPLPAYSLPMPVATAPGYSSQVPVPVAVEEPLVPAKNADASSAAASAAYGAGAGEPSRADRVRSAMAPSASAVAATLAPTPEALRAAFGPASASATAPSAVVGGGASAPSQAAGQGRHSRLASVNVQEAEEPVMISHASHAVTSVASVSVSTATASVSASAPSHRGLEEEEEEPGLPSRPSAAAPVAVAVAGGGVYPSLYEPLAATATAPAESASVPVASASGRPSFSTHTHVASALPATAVAPSPTGSAAASDAPSSASAFAVAVPVALPEAVPCDDPGNSGTSTARDVGSGSASDYAADIPVVAPTSAQAVVATAADAMAMVSHFPDVPTNHLPFVASTSVSGVAGGGSASAARVAVLEA